MELKEFASSLHQKPQFRQHARMYNSNNTLDMHFKMHCMRYKIIAELSEFRPQNENKKNVEMFVWKRENLSLTIIMETNVFALFFKRKVLSTCENIVNIIVLCAVVHISA